MSCTSKGEQVAVSFQLVEPPKYSVLTVDWPRSSTTTTPMTSYGKVIAAHRDAVLLGITYHNDNKYPRDSSVDLFVYHQAQASHGGDDDPSRRRLPSCLLLLPSTPAVINLPLRGIQAMGIMSCSSNDDSSPAFVVAYLDMCPAAATDGPRLWSRPATVDARLLRSGSGQWEVFKNLHVHGAVRDAVSNADVGRDLRWWYTDTVVPYGRRCIIWVDYYRGMILMDMSVSWRLQPSPEKNLPPPRLRYVPLSVDMVGDPEDRYYGSAGRGRPETKCSMCVTRHGVKFVSVDTQHWSNFGIGNHSVLTWSQRFRITTWSLREDGGGDDDYTWRKDATMHEEELWDTVDGGGHLGLPHVQPEFPVVDMDNPDVVVFQLNNAQMPKWMIEVNLRKKVLRTATVYSKEGGDVKAINSARVSQYDPVNSELPRDMDGEQAFKKRRQ